MNNIWNKHGNKFLIVWSLALLVGLSGASATETFFYCDFNGEIWVPIVTLSPIYPGAIACSEGQDQICTHSGSPMCGTDSMACVDNQGAYCYPPGGNSWQYGECHRGTLNCAGQCLFFQGPQIEYCNQLDDDCDGEVDEDLEYCVDITNELEWDYDEVSFNYYHPFGNSMYERLFLGNINEDLEEDYDHLSYSYMTSVNEKGIKTRSVTDKFGNLRGVMQDVGGLEISSYYEYDILGNLIRITDPKGNVAEYTYNSLGQLELVDHPDGGKSKFYYDLNGNLERTEILDGSEIIGEIFITYDDLNRMKVVISSSENYQGLGEFINYYYDDTNGPTEGGESCMDSSTSYGKLCRVEYMGHESILRNTEFFYDSRGRLSTRTIDFGDENIEDIVLTYEYDNADRLLGASLNIDTSDYATSFDYDKLSNLESVDYIGPSGEDSWTYNYDEFNRVESLAREDGIETSFDYNVRDWITSIDTDNSKVGEHAYNYDKIGNIVGMSFNTEDSSKSGDYVYDPLSRLKEARGDFYSSVGDSVYDYDAAGNRESLNKAGNLVDYNVQPSNNQMEDYTDEEGDTYSFTYTPTGALGLVEKNNNNFEDYIYDPGNKLVYYKNYEKGLEESYVYDHTGNRIMKCIRDSNLDYDLLKIYVYSLGTEPIYEREYAYPYPGCITSFEQQLSPRFSLWDWLKYFTGNVVKITGNAVNEIKRVGDRGEYSRDKLDFKTCEEVNKKYETCKTQIRSGIPSFSRDKDVNEIRSARKEISKVLEEKEVMDDSLTKVLDEQKVDKEIISDECEKVISAYKDCKYLEIEEDTGRKRYCINFECSLSQGDTSVNELTLLESNYYVISNNRRLAKDSDSVECRVDSDCPDLPDTEVSDIFTE